MSSGISRGAAPCVVPGLSVPIKHTQLLTAHISSVHPAMVYCCEAMHPTRPACVDDTQCMLAVLLAMPAQAGTSALAAIDEEGARGELTASSVSSF